MMNLGKPTGTRSKEEERQKKVSKLSDERKKGRGRRDAPEDGGYHRGGEEEISKDHEEGCADGLEESVGVEDGPGDGGH